MSDESFLMVSLEEEKSKKLAQVLSNDTSRKILDLLSKNNMMSETRIAKELDLPLSTAHYNLNLLLKSDLVNDEHFTYSEKGKKIVHYQLSNKYVIIAPKKSSKVFEKLKDFLPVVLISSLAAVVIKYFSSNLGTFSAKGNMMAIESATYGGAERVADAAAEPMAQSIQTVSSNQDLALWFLIGSLFALLVSFIWTTWIKKKK